MRYQVLTNSLLNEVWKSILFTIRANLQGCPSTLAAKYVNYLYPVRTFFFVICPNLSDKNDIIYCY